MLGDLKKVADILLATSGTMLNIATIYYLVKKDKKDKK